VILAYFYYLFLLCWCSSHRMCMVSDFIQGSIEKISSLTHSLDSRRKGVDQSTQNDSGGGLFSFAPEEGTTAAGGGGSRGGVEEASFGEGDSSLSTAAWTAKTEQEALSLGRSHCSCGIHQLTKRIVFKGMI